MSSVNLKTESAFSLTLVHVFFLHTHHTSSFGVSRRESTGMFSVFAAGVQTQSVVLHRQMLGTGNSPHPKSVVYELDTLVYSII